METKVIPYVSGGSKNSGTTNTNTSTNIWQFLAKNEKGNTFELPLASFYEDSDKPSVGLNKKYITLN